MFNLNYIKLFRSSLSIWTVPRTLCQLDRIEKDDDDDEADRGAAYSGTPPRGRVPVETTRPRQSSRHPKTIAKWAAKTREPPGRERRVQ